jgi:hypothetical protein
MQTKAIWFVVGVIVLALLGYGFMDRDEKTEDMEIGEVPESQEVMEGKKMAFSEFIKGGGSYKCEVHQNINGGDNVGTVYVSNGMTRGEFEMTTGGKIITMSMIARDGYSYSWSTMTPGMGMKVKIVSPDTMNPGTKTPSQSFDTDEIGDYDCDPWTLDTSKFAVPTDIKFQSLN